MSVVPRPPTRRLKSSRHFIVAEGGEGRVSGILRGAIANQMGTIDADLDDDFGSTFDGDPTARVGRFSLPTCDCYPTRQARERTAGHRRLQCQRSGAM